MEFWKLAIERRWCTPEQLRLAVLTEDNPYGDITPEQYEEITGIKF